MPVRALLQADATWREVRGALWARLTAEAGVDGPDCCRRRSSGARLACAVGRSLGATKRVLTNSTPVARGGNRSPRGADADWKGRLENGGS